MTTWGDCVLGEEERTRLYTGTEMFCVKLVAENPELKKTAWKAELLLPSIKTVFLRDSFCRSVSWIRRDAVIPLSML